ncbi:uncharacterized protein LOC127785046 [Oryza glaberrima]|uniref:uncharacterized protein LOC127785046 n=1 Tax=Oryza glaberrima TaxID=4538 RepID=UPI00224C01FF|nr:uncharacterized protein LOC127785046 [Oryza glaberrima]
MQKLKLCNLHSLPSQETSTAHNTYTGWKLMAEWQQQVAQDIRILEEGIAFLLEGTLDSSPFLYISGKSVDHFLPGESFASIIEGRQQMFVSQDRKNLPFSLSQAASYVVFL